MCFVAVLEAAAANFCKPTNEFLSVATSIDQSAVFALGSKRVMMTQSSVQIISFWEHFQFNSLLKNH